MQVDGRSEKEVMKRVQAGWGAWKKITGVMCDKKVTDKFKGRLYKVMLRPALLHGMETVAATKTQEKRMEVAEMKMLRFSKGNPEKTELETRKLEVEQVWWKGGRSCEKRY